MNNKSSLFHFCNKLYLDDLLWFMKDYFWTKCFNFYVFLRKKEL